MNNNSRRNFPINDVDADRDANENMKIKLLVSVADGDDSDGPEDEEKIRTLIEPTIKETKFPLGSDVTVSRVTIDDFDECASAEYNDCSERAVCTNIKVSTPKIVQTQTNELNPVVKQTNNFHHCSAGLLLMQLHARLPGHHAPVPVAGPHLLRGLH